MIGHNQAAPALRRRHVRGERRMALTRQEARGAERTSADARRGQARAGQPTTMSRALRRTRARLSAAANVAVAVAGLLREAEGLLDRAAPGPLSSGDHPMPLGQLPTVTGPSGRAPLDGDDGGAPLEGGLRAARKAENGQASDRGLAM